MHRNVLLAALCVLIFGQAIAFRINSGEVQKIPREQLVTLIAAVKNQPKIGERSAIIEIGDARLFVGHYPKYRVGDKLRVEGFVDGDGRIFNAKVEKIGEVYGIQYWVSSIRNRISANINKLLPAREAALVSGMVLGIDSIDEKFRQQLIETGTIHVVVVSGQNLSIVAGLFLSTTKFAGRRLSLLLVTVAVFAYALLTGFEPPVVRASLMVLLSSIAIYFGREKIAVWSLVLAALVILFFAPSALFEISFQLTFAATLGIMTLGQWLSTRLRKFGLLGNNAAIATSAYLFTLPIIYFYFGRVSFLAPIVNTFVAEAVLPIMILGFAIAFAGLIFAPLAQLLAYLAYVPALYFVAVVEFFSKVT